MPDEPARPATGRPSSPSTADLRRYHAKRQAEIASAVLYDALADGAGDGHERLRDEHSEPRAPLPTSVVRRVPSAA